MSQLVQVQTTVENAQQGQRIAQTLVQRHLAACVQVLGPIESHYQWEGRQEQTQEWLLLIKTTAERLPGLREELLRLHPYQVPEVIALPVLDAHPPYARWVEEHTQREP